MSEELIKRLHLAANGASFDGRAGDAFLMREAAHALSRPAPVQAPEEWVAVPMMPTETMMDAAADTCSWFAVGSKAECDAQLLELWATMLAAAPSTPAAPSVDAEKVMALVKMHAEAGDPNTAQRIHAQIRSLLTPVL